MDFCCYLDLLLGGNLSLSVLTQSLLPGRAVSATSTVNQHKPDPITGYTQGDLDKRGGVEEVLGEKRKDQNRKILDS